MKLCVFQGTFNPVHKVHIKMAEYVIKNYDVDKVLFIPAGKPPHKNYDPDLSVHRLNMVKLATEKNPKFEVSDIEYKTNRISYTYLTILELYRIYKIDGKIKFIIGTDAFKQIDTWYEADKLKTLVDFIVFKRENTLDQNKYNELKSKGYNFTFAEMEYENVSSTTVRKTHKDVTEEVKRYIEENELYK